MSTPLTKQTSMSEMEYVNRIAAERDKAPDLARNLTIRFTSPHFLSTFILVLIILIIAKYLIGDLSVLKYKLLNFIARGQSMGFSNALYGSVHNQMTPSSTGGSNKLGIFIAVTVVVIIAFLITVYALRKSRKNEYDDNEVVMIHDGLLKFENSAKAASAKLNRSENKPGGAEFAYAMFVRINRYIPPVGRSSGGSELIIMQKGKGSPSDTDVRRSRNCPSITYKDGTLYFYLDVINENGAAKEPTFELRDVPIKRDFHLIFAVRGRDVDIYIDGTLAKRHRLSNNIAYNNDEARFSINASAYEGHLGRIMYIRHYPRQDEIESMSDPYITQKLVDFIPCS